MNQSPPAPGTQRPRHYFILIIVALLAIALGIYQWWELVQIRTGGTEPLCSVSKTINCATVWNSPLASAVHDRTGIPFAGWGVAWAFIVLFLGIELFLQTRKGNPSGDVALALRLTSVIGSLVALGLLAYSITIKVICPTCFLFYIFVAAVTFIAFRIPRDSAWQWRPAMLHSGGLFLICIALLFYPGRHTPQQNTDLAALAAADQSGADTSDSGAGPLAKFLSALPPQVQQLISDSRALYLAAPFIDRPVDSNRLIYGTANAPVHIIDWIDIRCPHCKHLEEALTQIRRKTPASSWSEEGRHFPLDSECNPNVRHSDNTHVACLAAKVLICLGGSPRGTQARTAFFQRQGLLTTESIWDIAASTPAQKDKLESCVNSQKTDDMLQGDIDFAMEHHIQGTPLVVINGRQAPGYPPFIYAMIIARGDANSVGFKVLPPPREQVLDR